MFIFHYPCEARSPTWSPTQFSLVFIIMPRDEVLRTASKPIPKTIAARFSPSGFSGRSSRALALRTAESGRPNFTCFAIAGYRLFWLNAVLSPTRSKHSLHRHRHIGSRSRNRLLPESSSSANSRFLRSFQIITAAWCTKLRNTEGLSIRNGLFTLARPFPASARGMAENCQLQPALLRLSAIESDRTATAGKFLRRPAWAHKHSLG